MAPTARTSLSLPEYSTRERKAILLLTLGFIILSALVHLGLGAMYRPTRPVADATPQPHESMIITRLDTPAPTPQPTPTPIPRAQPRATPQIHQQSDSAKPTHDPHVQPPTRGLDGSSPGPTADPGIGPGPVHSPGIVTPTTEPTPQVYAPCRMLRKAQPDYPEFVKSAGIQGTASVIVAIGPDGQVQSARIGETSGNASLDNAALAAARSSTYACPLAQGRPEAELYQVIYQFKLDSN